MPSARYTFVSECGSQGIRYLCNQLHADKLDLFWSIWETWRAGLIQTSNQWCPRTSEHQGEGSACLIRTFLKTSSNPSFNHNLYHSTLLRYHVFGETSLPNPGFPPYYPSSFIETIQHAHENNPLDITRMSLWEGTSSSWMTLSKWMKWLTHPNPSSPVVLRSSIHLVTGPVLGAWKDCLVLGQSMSPFSGAYYTTSCTPR